MEEWLKEEMYKRNWMEKKRKTVEKSKYEVRDKSKQTNQPRTEVKLL